MKTYGTLALFLVLLAGCLPTGEKSELSFKAAVRSPANCSGPDPAASKAAFKSTIYPIVRGNTCVNCHNSAKVGQAPVFADDNVDKAFEAITLSKKVDLIVPADTRLAKKVESGHNCGTGSCADLAADFVAAATEWAKLAPSGDCSGIALTTSELPFPQDTSSAQTEWGTLILQAEQPQHTGVQDGRFVPTMDSQASDGYYLSFPMPESNPNGATRTFTVNNAEFSSCREFTDADFNAPATRVIRIMQEKTHNPSENVMSGSNIVNDGYLPRIARLRLSIIRPDRRVQFAENMLMTRDFSSVNNHILRDSNPSNGDNLPKVLGATLKSLTGNNETSSPGIFVLPKGQVDDTKLVQHSVVFNELGNFKSGKELHEIFKDPFDETDSSLASKLMDTNFANLKRQIFYPAVKNFFTNVHYNGGVLRASADIPYGNFMNSSVQNLMSRNVSVTYQCPPAQNCVADSGLLQFSISASGPVLTQDNALDCYTISAGSFVAAAASNCNNGVQGYFHLIDAYVHVSVENSIVNTRSTNTFLASTTPSSHVDVESFTTAAEQIFLNNMAQTEESPDYLFVAGSNTLNPADELANYSTTLFPAIRSATCINCHHPQGMPTPQEPFFAQVGASSSLSVIKSAGLVNFNTPQNSFRDTNNFEMVHNCGTPTQCNAIKTQFIGAINDWKAANEQSSQASGAEKFKNYTRNERLPGRVKYQVKITEAGDYNLWFRLKNSLGATVQQRLHYRILQNGTTPVQYRVGSNGTPAASPCFNWTVNTTLDAWDWITPGRSAEYGQIDQRGFILFDNNKNPLTLQNQRHYYNLTKGDYTIDVIGLTPGMKVDALALNKVANPSDWRSRLEFQPDRRAVDSGHVADYKRHVLTYDISKQLKLSGDKKAFFEIEVKKGLDNKNYIFRNPRFRTIPRDFNISFKALKVLINGKWSVPDATYNKLKLVVGDNKVITYAPLLALAESSSDTISFGFDELSVTKASLSTLYPKGEPVNPLAAKHCNDLQFFIKNVKPILREAKVMLNSEWDAYVDEFPGAPRRAGSNSPQAYNCIDCHNATHPYFKMSTFTNDDEFCREALSRVDFDYPPQSLVVRGINGTGNHPKFVFVEKFIKDGSGFFRTHTGDSDFQSNRIKSEDTNIASEPWAGPMRLWSYNEITTHPSYAGIADKAAARAKAGLPRRISSIPIPEAVTNYVWYDPAVHYTLIYDQNDNYNGIESAMDVIQPAGGSISSNRMNGAANPRVYVLEGFNGTGPISATNLGDRSNNNAIKAGTKSYKTGANPGHDPATVDWDASTPAQDSRDAMLNKWEELRHYYRQTVIDWIYREKALKDQ